MTDVLEGFESTTFEFDGKTRQVLRSGSGPAVIVIAEMPGITPGVLGLRPPGRRPRLHGGAAVVVRHAGSGDQPGLRAAVDRSRVRVP